MILFCGIPSEPPLRLAIESAEASCLPYLIFNQREAHHWDILLEASSSGLSGRLAVGGAEYQLADFRSVYNRMMDWSDLPENRPLRRSLAGSAAGEKSHALHASLAQWLDLAPVRVVNRNRCMGSNLSKPYQAQIIQAHGFPTPPTLVTNSPEQVQDFAEEHGRVIYKSISSVRSIVRELHARDRQRLAHVRRLPTQFQAWIPGHNIRVHVVGEDCFATEVVSDAIDYRYAGRDDLLVEMRAISLPGEVAERCVRLSRFLELDLSGIDLKRTPNGEWYCFEVNPSPAYSCYQEQTEQPIAAALVSWLSQSTH